MLAPIASLAMLGCQVAVVDLGSNHAPEVGAGGGDAGPVTTSNCPYVTEAEVQALYGDPCNSTCAEGAGTPRAVMSSAELVAVISGQWRTCGGELPWDSDAGSGVVGIEFQAGCTIFLLHDAPDGGVVRGIQPSDQGTYNVLETIQGSSITRRVELFFPGVAWTVAATTSDCPHRMALAALDGGGGDFVGIPSGLPPTN